jgi:hypothetical protein
MNLRTVFMLPAATFLSAAFALVFWWRSDSADTAKLRLPGADAPAGTNGAPPIRADGK